MKPSFKIKCAIKEQYLLFIRYFTGAVPESAGWDFVLPERPYFGEDKSLNSAGRRMGGA